MRSENKLQLDKLNMRNIPSILNRTAWGCAAAFVIAFATGCQTNDQSSTPATPAKTSTVAPAPSTPAPVVAPAAAAPAAPEVAVPAAGKPAIIRIKAAATSPFTDSSGNVWKAEEGFEGGSVISREGTEIANTKDSGLFNSEHYGMDSFSCSLPNGNYIAKLYFAETFEGITGPGQRVFSYNVQGHEFKDFDIWAKAGGPNRAYIETVPVEVKDGKFKITFTSNIENPEITAIEIIPQ